MARGFVRAISYAPGGITVWTSIPSVAVPLFATRATIGIENGLGIRSIRDRNRAMQTVIQERVRGAKPRDRELRDDLKENR